MAYESCPVGAEVVGGFVVGHGDEVLGFEVWVGAAKGGVDRGGAVRDPLVVALVLSVG